VVAQRERQKSQKVPRWSLIVIHRGNSPGKGMTSRDLPQEGQREPCRVDRPCANFIMQDVIRIL